MSLRIASYNSNKKLGAKSITLRHLCREASSNNIDIICLQESGRTSPVGLSHPEVLGSYQLLICTTGKQSESIGFLVHTRLKHCIVGFSELFQGRLCQLDLKLPEFSISVVSAYFPTMLNDAKIDSPNFKEAIAMTDILLKILKASPRVVIAGDFNEKILDTDISSGNIGNYPCRFLFRLVGRSGFCDLSRKVHKHTCFRHTGSSKIDRILCTRALSNLASNYSVSNGGYLGSDHAIISADFRLRKPFVPKRDKPKYYRLRISRMNEFQISCFKREVYKSVTDLETSLSEELRLYPTETDDILNRYIECFVKIVHQRFWDALGSYNEEDFAFTSFEDHLQGKRGAPKKVGLRKSANSHPILTNLETAIEALRSLKFELSTVTSIPDGFTERLLEAYKFDGRIETNLINLKKQVRSFIRSTEKDIRNYYESHGLTDAAVRNSSFQRSRKHFNRTYLHNQGPRQGDLSVIFDPVTKRVVADRGRVHSVVISEGKKLFCCKDRPPTEKPEWYRKLYRKGSRVEHLIQDGFSWDDMIKPFTLGEIFDAVCCKSDSAPGFDQIDKNVYKCLFKDEKGYSIVIRFVQKILNAWFDCGVCPTHFSKGVISLLPKPGKENSTKYAHKRPITLLSDFSKIGTKIIANRLSDILHRWDILDPSQAGFIKEGSCDKPIRFLMDQIKRCNDEGRFFLGIWIDLSKAFDLVFPEVIEATLYRFDFPEKLIRFLVDYYKSALSAYKTAWGRTEFFQLKNGIRQGCPLSPLMFLMVIDSFHSYMRDLDHSVGIGIRWGANMERREVSLGLADDSAGISNLIDGIKRFWRDTQEYFRVHAGRLNADKTVARFNRAFAASGLVPRLIRDPVWGSGDDRVKWKGPTVPFRYLGIQLRLDLSCESHLEWLERKKLYPLWRSMRLNSFNFLQALTTYKEVVLSTWRWTSKFMSLDSKFTKKWTGMFFRELINLAGVTPGRVLYDAFSYILDTFDLERYSVITFISETLIFLNSFNSHWNLSTRVEACRNKKIFRCKEFIKGEPLCNVGVYSNKYGINIFKNRAYNGRFDSIDDQFKLDFQPTRRVKNVLDSLGALEFSPNFESFIQSGNGSTKWYIFSDGSAKDHSIGWGIGIWKDNSENYATVCGGFRDDIHYEAPVCASSLAEAVGSVAAFLATYEIGGCCSNFTDCYNSVSAARVFESGSQRERFRTNCRPIFRAIHHVRKSFQSGSLIAHTHGHQDGSSDPYHRRNAIAHDLACKGRELVAIRGRRINLLKWDFPFGLSLEMRKTKKVRDVTETCIGDPIRSLKSFLRESRSVHSLFRSWHDSPSCGRLLRLDPNRVKSLLRSEDCKSVKSSGFFMDMVMTNYPNQTLIDLSQDFESECSFCNGGAPDDDSHFLTCPGVIYHKHIQRSISKICKLPILNRTLGNLGTSVKGLIRAHIQRAKVVIRERRSDIPSSIVERLLFSYFCDLSHIDEAFNEKVLIGAIRELPGISSTKPKGTRMLSPLEINTLEGDTRVPLDLVVLLSLTQLPRYYYNWHLYHPNFDRCARRFGEISNIERSHRDMIFLIVFSEFNAFLQSLLKLAYKRVERNASTWFIHTKSVNLSIPIFENHTIRLAELYVTVIRPVTKQLTVPSSGLPRAIKCFNILENMPDSIFAFPFLGFGKLGNTINPDDLPPTMKQLFIEQKTNFAPDFLLGFFKPTFMDEFDKKSRSLLRQDLLKLAIPTLKLIHRVRLQYYSYLRSGFNIFPRPSVKLRTVKKKRSRETNADKRKAKRRKFN